MSTAPPPANRWAQESERGSRVALRVMAFIAVAFGRGVARWVLHPITLYFVLFARGSRRHSARYLQRALGRPARIADLYRHVHCFAATVLDRVYLARGRLQEFDLRVEGAALMDELVASGHGGAAAGRAPGQLRSAACGGRRPARIARGDGDVPRQRTHDPGDAAPIAPGFHLDIITIGRSHSTLAVRDWLDDGGLVGMLGDRVLGAEGPRANLIELPFLGRMARFSDGPLRLAMLLRRPVVFMVALYRGGQRYDVRFELLADFTELPCDPAQRDNRLRDALQAYVQRLEALCREAPYNWFNFFDFWNEDART